MSMDLPYTITPGTLAKAEEVQQNFLALKAKFDGNIVDSDISGNAAIQGLKLYSSTDNSVKIPTGAIKDFAIIGGAGLGSKISASKTIVNENLALLSVGTGELRNLAVDFTKLDFTAFSKTFSVQTLVTPEGVLLTETDFPGLPTVAAGIPAMVYLTMPTANTCKAGVSFEADSTSGRWRVRVFSLATTIISLSYMNEFGIPQVIALPVQLSTDLNGVTVNVVCLAKS
jgi:hypothetical protein